MGNSVYVPDNWVIVKLDCPEPHYRVLSGWSGGYFQGSSWRLNSGIVRVEEDDNSYKFYGASGSSYTCHKECYGIRMNTAGVWAQLQQIHGDLVSLLEEDTNFIGIDWIIK